MSQPMGQAAPKSSRATTSLVLGILGFLCCQLCAPFAWYMGKQELAAIRAGTSPASGEGSAKAGMILGLIGTILLILTLVWIFGFGGWAMIQAMRGAQGS
jgi:hypothetical protein